MRITLLTSVALAALLVAGSASAERHNGHGAPAATGAPAQLVHPGGGRAMHGGIGREMHGRAPHGQSILRGTTPRSTARFGADRDQHGRDQHGRNLHGGAPAVTTPHATTGGPRNTHGTGRGGVHHDWTRYHRTVTASHRYHFGTYRRPRGWVNRRWSVGAFLPSLFWAQQYWINSYYDFGLPPPPPGARWVRYGSDALLIDDFTGEIIQVVYGIFY